MIIRKAKKKDLEEIERMIFDLNISISQKDFWKKDPQKTKTLSRTKMIDDFKNPNKVIFIAEEKNEVVGYAIGTIKNQNPIFKIKKIGYINDVYTLKPFRREGIGEKLMQSLLKHFKNKGLKAVQLSVLTNNKPALKLYQSLGFKENRKKMVKRI